MLAAIPSMPPTDLSSPVEKEPQTIAVNSVNESKLSSPLAQHKATRKSRPLRRRRRAGEGEDSEDEIVRESHSGTESDESSHLEESATDSEPEEEDVMQPEHVKSGEHSPASVPHVEEEKEITVKAVEAVETVAIVAATVIAPPQNWSDMVTDELDDGQNSSLPVIDFADFGASGSSHTPPLTSATTPPDVSAEEAASFDVPAPPNGDATERPPAGTPRSVSARQAYLERLNNDPSFIPRVGAFWGHDDRLLDKGLRSMSPWWRDRQMAFRGRGMSGRGGYEERGLGFRGRGRGRGGTANYGGRGEAEQAPPTEQVEAGPSEPPQPHPADLPWSHDGYEEMRRIESERHQSYRGRGRGFNPNFRGRGGFYRGGSPFVNGQNGTPDASTTSDYSQSPSQPQPHPHPAPKHWVKRPEKPWTKEFAGYLYSDPSLKPRHDRGAGIRLKFPGSPDEGVVVRLPIAGEAAAKGDDASSTTSKGKKEPTVRLPGAGKKGRQASVNAPAEAGDFAQTMGQLTVGTPPPVDGAVESTPASNKESVTAPSAALPAAVSEAYASLPPPVTIPSTAREAAVDPVTVLEQKFEQLQMAATQPNYRQVNGQTGDTSLIIPPTETSNEASQPAPARNAPPPPSLQMPPAPYPPQYPYGIVLPPGIAMDENGVCYEVSTGRVVVLHQPTPPPIYNPRPIAHPGYAPPHVRAMQNPSPDGFIPSPYSMTPDGRPLPSEAYPYAGNEQAGMPFFAQRRSSGPVSIRSPVERRPSTSSANKSTPGAEGSGALLRAAVHAPEFRPGSQMAPQPYAGRMSYFPSWGNEAPVSPQRMDPRDGTPGQPMLPDDPAIVGREPMMVQDPGLVGQYPYYVDPAYGFGQVEYPYTPYGYEVDGYGAPVDGGRHSGSTVYY